MEFSGGEALQKRGILTLKYPVLNGLVVNWDDLEKLLHHTLYNELRQEPSESIFLIAEDPFTPAPNREKMTQILFEDLNVPAMAVIPAPVLSLASINLNSGLVWETGEHSYCCVVEDGKVLKESLRNFGISGKEITAQLLKLAKSRGIEDVPAEFVRSMKHSFCFVSQDYNRDMEMDDSLFQKSVELPDGSVIQLGKEWFQSTEILFQPSLGDFNFGGVHECLEESLQQCSNFCKDILICGGNSCFPGLASRLQKEMQKKSGQEYKIHSPPNRGISSWIGGSIVSCRPDFVEKCLKKEEYDEIGPTAIHRFC